MHVGWVQHAVGHGGFHTGHAFFDGAAPFTWVFDCGSRRTSKFDAYLAKWTGTHQGKIDWLFISHFDLDHVSGLDTLMSRAVVQNVMVPYVNERELAYALLHEIGRGNLSRSFVGLVADPAEFFLSRGATTVTFLGGDRPEDDRGGGEVPSRGPKEDRDLWFEISPRPRSIAVPEPLKAISAEKASLQIIDAPQCEMGLGHGPFGLRLKPYRLPIQTRAHVGLLKALAAAVGAPVPQKRWKTPGLGQLAYAIARHARTTAGRAALKIIYKSHVGSSNRSSLSLLSMPSIPVNSEGKWSTHRPSWFTSGTGTPGWINTGDAELLDPIDLAQWKACYSSDLSRVRVLALPHHGSDKNSDVDLQKLCPHARLVAHVKSNATKHPGVAVTLAAGSRLSRVSELQGSEVSMHFWTS